MNAPVRTAAALGSRVSRSAVAQPSSVAGSSAVCQKYTKQTNQRRALSTRTVLFKNRPSMAAPKLALLARHISSSASSSSTSASASASTSQSSASSSTTAPTDHKLDWNSFFTLRASRRKYSLISSILTSLTTTATGAQVIMTQNFENVGAQVLGFDPIVVLGIATAACGAAGWLAGPVLGNGLWGMVYRKYRRDVAAKEKEFYNRIKRFRVDPSTNSFANPVPDYYGEKIGSVQGYRQWLKDQRAFNRKRRGIA